jgi:hypothetical protein
MLQLIIVLTRQLRNVAREREKIRFK